jgi:hypothetical protein
VAVQMEPMGAPLAVADLSTLVNQITFLYQALLWRPSSEQEETLRLVLELEVRAEQLALRARSLHTAVAEGHPLPEVYRERGV